MELYDKRDQGFIEVWMTNEEQETIDRKALTAQMPFESICVFMYGIITFLVITTFICYNEYYYLKFMQPVHTVWVVV